MVSMCVFLFFPFILLCFASPHSVSHHITSHHIVSLFRYVLNPSGDLKSTEAVLTPVFRSYAKTLGWEAVQGNGNGDGNGDGNGRAPSSALYRDALLGSDLFIYCGHGNGEQVHCISIQTCSIIAAGTSCMQWRHQSYM